MTWNGVQWKLRMLLFDCYQLLMGGVDKDISIFCNNCIGAFVAHDFRLPFNSPTVNLMIPPAEFITYISDLGHYISAPITALESDKGWPVALLGGEIHLNLVHYNSVEEGAAAWHRREKRINVERMYFILVETDGCTHEDLRAFDALPYKHKVALTHKPYPDIRCSFCIKGYVDVGAVTDSYRFDKILPLRRYDQFDWMKFLKQK